MAIGKNIIANVAGRVWSIISIYVFVPLYIKILGVETYGVISFYSLLLVVLAFADAGLTATLNREFAKASTLNLSYKQSLLRTFEYIYLIIGLFVVSITFFGAPIIVNQFIKTQEIPYQDLVNYVRIMGFIIAFYLVSSLYNGGLMGLQKQVLSNTLQIGYGIVRSGFVIIPLIWIRDLNLYFIWQLFAAVFYAFILRHFLYKFIRTSEPIKSNFSYLKSIWKYAFGMMLMAIIYSVNTQIDKIYISRLLSLTDFTYYSLAAMLSQAVLILATPIGMAFFPELTRLVSIKDKAIKSFYHKFAYVIAAVTSSLAVILFYYSHDYILLWTHNIDIANEIFRTTNLLTIGAMFMSIQLCPYYLALSNGYTRANVSLGLVSIICIIPSLQILIPKLGLLGAAVPWLIINFLATVILGYIIMAKFMRGEFIKWLLKDSVQPVLISFCIGTILHFLFNFLPQNTIYSVIYGIMIVAIVIMINGYFFIHRYPEIKQEPVIKKILNFRIKK